MVNDLVISLLRHGLTLENEQKAYIGWTDVPLSKTGIERLINKQLNIRQAELIFSSPLRRCIETAEILFPNNEITLLNELKELHFGAWEGKTYDQLKNNKLYRNWLTNIFTEPIEAGETFTQFGDRIANGLQKIKRIAVEKQSNHIAIVTHGGVIRYILHSLFPHEKSFFDWQISFGSGYELRWQMKQFKEDDSRCTLLSVEPTTVKRIG